MSVRRARAVGAPGGATPPGVGAAPASRLDAVLRAGQAPTSAPQPRTFMPTPERASKPTRPIQWHYAHPDAEVEYTTEPLQTFISTDELNAYSSAMQHFESILALYERGRDNMYPSEARSLEAYSKSLPMSDNKKRILESRLVEIQGIIATDSEPERNIDNNSEYIDLLKEYVAHINKIMIYQLSPGAKSWRAGTGEWEEEEDEEEDEELDDEAIDWLATKIKTMLEQGTSSEHATRAS
jgi:hypothetical protein